MVKSICSLLLWICVVFVVQECSAQDEKWTVFNRRCIISGIAIDSNGHTWIATQGCGIAKYTGTKWIVYNEIAGGLPSDITRCILVDKNNAVWVGTDLGLCVFKNDEFSDFYEYNSQVNALAMDSAGNIWMGGRTGLKKFDGSTWSTHGTFSTNIYNLGISSLALDSKGTTWFTYLYQGSPMGSLIHYDGSSTTEYNANNSCIPNDYLRGLYIDAKNTKWFGSNAGLARLDNAGCKLYTTTNSGLAHNSVMTVCGDSRGMKWVVTLGGGIQTFNDTVWKTFNVSNSGFSEDNIFTMTIDQYDVKWLGTMNKGIDVFRDTFIRHLPRFTAEIPSDAVTAIAFDTSNVAFVCTDRKMTRFDNNTWTTYEVPNNGAPSPVNRVNDIVIEDKNNYKWVATSYGGLGRFNKTAFTQYDNINSNIPNIKVTSIVLDSAGNKWIGTPSGLAKFTGTQWTTYYNIPVQMQLSATALAIDKNGHFWIANETGYGTFMGLVKFDGTNWIYFNPQNTGLPNFPNINTIACDDSGHIWIGTQSFGLVKFDGSNWIVYNKNNSKLPEDNVLHVMVDSRDVVWVCTERGLVKVDEDQWQVYTTKNSDIPINYILTAEEDRNGNIWIGTNGGGFARLGTCNVDTGVAFAGSGVMTRSTAEFYQWVDCNNGYAIIPGANQRYFKPKVSGHYAVIMAEDNCIDTSACYAVTACDINTSLKKTGSELSAVDSGGNYQWMDCNSKIIIQGAVSRTFIPSASGRYAVIIQKGTCIDTSDCFNITGLKENTWQETISLYPNPALNEVTVIAGKILDKISVSIYDPKGILCYNVDIHNTDRVTVDLNKLPEGIYFAEVNGRTYKLLHLTAHR